MATKKEKRTRDRENSKKNREIITKTEKMILL
jgi:hypothetical protein